MNQPAYPHLFALVLLLLTLSAVSSPARAEITRLWSTSAAAEQGEELLLSSPGVLQQGDVLILQIAVRGGPAVAREGWTMVRHDALGGMEQRLFYRVVEGDEQADYRWPHDGLRAAAGMSAFRGVDPSEPIDVHGGSSALHYQSTAPSLNASEEGGYLLGFFAGATDRAFSVPSGMSALYAQREGNPLDGLSVMSAGQALRSAGATGTRTATFQSLLPYANLAQALVLKELDRNVVLTANGQDVDTLVIEVGERVAFEAVVSNCNWSWWLGDILNWDRWVERWRINGAEQTRSSSIFNACSRSPFSWSRTFNQVGEYRVEFGSEVCEFYGILTGICWGGQQTYGVDSITIVVVDSTATCNLGGFRIVQQRYAIACPTTPAEVSIQALCSDGRVKTNYVGTAALSADASGARFYASPAGGAELSELNFTGADEGRRNVYLYYTNEHPDLRVQVRDLDSGVSSTAGTGTDFGIFGFLLDVPDQAPACEAHSASLVAYGQLQDAPGCGVITNFSGPKPLKMWFAYSQPADNPAGTRLASPQANGALPTMEPAHRNAELLFEQGRGRFGFSYADAGAVELLFKYDSERYDGDPHDPVEARKAGSSSIVLHPARFGMRAVNAAGENLTAVSAGDQPVQVAGTAFELEFAAQCSDGTLTPNYKPTADSERLLAYVERTGPAPAGAEGLLALDGVASLPTALGPPQALGDYRNMPIAADRFDSGSYRFTAAEYSEVGLIRLHLIDRNYFGAQVGPSSLDIGRFVPQRFVLSQVGDGPELGNLNPNDFTYLGHNAVGDDERVGAPLPWEIPPLVEVMPVNARGQFTRNYGADYWTLDDAQTQRLYVEQESIAPLFGYATGAVERIGSDDFDEAPAFWSFSEDALRYERPLSPLNPFSADVTLTLAKADLIDADGVCYRPSATSDCSEFTLSAITGAHLRYGQGFQQDSYGMLGRAGDRLPIAVHAAYYDNGWHVNEDDSSSWIAAYLLETDGLPMEADPLTVRLHGGRAELGVRVTSGSGGYGRGVLDVGWPVWLGGSGQATAQFGIYRGDDRFLYWSADE